MVLGKCPHCMGTNVIKDGKRNFRQSYRCKDCKHVFCQTKKKQTKLQELRNEYVFGKQTYPQLAAKNNVCPKTIQRKLDAVSFSKQKVNPCPIILMIDTVYFGKRRGTGAKNWGTKKGMSSRGISLFRGFNLRKNIKWTEVKSENLISYKECIDCIISEGREIAMIVCDGFNGIPNYFRGIPIQLCQRHEMDGVRRVLTRNPQNIPDIKLLDIAYNLSKYRSEKEFLDDLGAWYDRFGTYIEERYPSGEFIHPKTRSVYKKLLTDSPYLFTYLDPDVITKVKKLKIKGKIPRTTGSIESIFTHLRVKDNVHRGLKWERRYKLISQLLDGAEKFAS